MDFLIGVAAQTALLHSSFDGYGDSTRVFAALERDGIYAKAGYENGRSRIDGQPWFDVEAVTAGAGYRLDITDRLSFRVEGGWWKPTTTDLDAAIRDEIAFTYLVSRHAVGGLKPIPLPQVEVNVFGVPMLDYAPCADWGRNFPDECYSSTASIGEGLYVEVGATARVYGGFEVDASYRELNPNSSVTLFHPETRANGGGYWREDGLLDLSSFNLSVQYRF